MKKLLQLTIFCIIFAVQVQLNAQRSYTCNLLVVNDNITYESKLVNVDLKVSVTDTTVNITNMAQGSDESQFNIGIKFPFWVDDDQYKGVTRTTLYMLTWYYFHDKLSITIIDADLTWTMYLKPE